MRNLEIRFNEFVILIISVLDTLVISFTTLGIFIEFYF